MLNQLRADYYKLFHSKLSWVTGALFVIFLAIFIAMSLGNAAFPMGGIIGDSNGIPLRDGFIGFVYKDPAHPLFWELAYTSTAFTFFTWIVLMVLSVQFVSREYQTGTIKLAVSYGISTFKIYISKLIVVISFWGLLFYFFNIITFAVTSAVKNYVPTFGNIMSLLALLTLYFLVLAVFVLICFTLYIAIRSTAVVSAILPVFMYSVIAVVATFASKRPFLAECYLRINPMDYLDSVSRFWADPSITRNILLYTVIGLTLLLTSSYFLLRKQEIK